MSFLSSQKTGLHTLTAFLTPVLQALLLAVPVGRSRLEWFCKTIFRSCPQKSLEVRFEMYFGENLYSYCSTC